MSEPLYIQDFTYDLPTDRIAMHPLADRDSSNLLVYNKGILEHASFKSLADYLPENSFLFFNDTKVIPARILFSKDTGAVIEIFLLNPVRPSPIMAEVMLSRKECTWQCTIGNLKRWKVNQQLQKNVGDIQLTATLINRLEGIVQFNWEREQTFAELVTLAGVTPLPPYIKREASVQDISRYQTIYSHYEGAVAAPTAGLHFTESVFNSLKEKGIHHDFVTLHVSAGTFQPVKTDNALEHTMHHEQVVVSKQAIENLIQPNRFIIAVGTTSIRTLESVYWYGVKLLEDPESEFLVTQDDPYVKRVLPDRKQALLAVLKHLKDHELQTLIGNTSIFIRPGYSFKICQGLVTNFHLPGSTLILLVAAFVGNDWKKIYNEALQKNYRFLSYGDSSLLLPVQANQ